MGRVQSLDPDYARETPDQWLALMHVETAMETYVWS
jgi:hypothetical protein